MTAGIVEVPHIGPGGGSSPPGSSPPTNPSDLWLRAHLFNANWSEGITNTSSFQTSPQHGISAAEHRYGLTGKPVRTTSARFNTGNFNQVQSLLSMIQRAGTARHLFPLFSDVSRLIQDVSVSATSILCETALRRFFPGKLIVIFTDDADMQPEKFEIVEIDNIPPISFPPGLPTITLETGLTQAFPAGSYIAPLIEARVLVEAQGRVLTDGKASASLTAIEQIGGHQLPMIEAGTFDEYQGLPIFDIPVDFRRQINFGINRLHSSTDSGIDAIMEFYGSRARNTLSLPVSCFNRAEAWRTIQFFERCRGRLQAFFAPHPLTEFNVISVAGGGASIVIEAIGPEVDWEFRPYVAVETLDGDVIIRQVQEVTRNAGQDTVIFTETINGLTTGDIARMTTAVKARLDTDEMTERWHTNSVMETDFRLVEVLEEKQINISDLLPINTSDLSVLGVTDLGFAFPEYYTQSRALRMAGSGLSIATWDDVGSHADVEVYGVLIPQGTSNHTTRVFARASGSTGSENGYLISCRRGAGSTDFVTPDTYELGKFVNGEYTVLDSVTGLGVRGNQWLEIRLRVSGSSLLGKVWRLGEPEPAGWSLSATDSDISEAGWVGGWASGAADMDRMGVGIGGETAPKSIGFDGVLPENQHFTDFRTHPVSPSVDGWTKRWATGSISIVSASSQLGYAVPHFGWNRWWSTFHRYDVVAPEGTGINEAPEGATNGHALRHNGGISLTINNTCFAYYGLGLVSNIDARVRCRARNTSTSHVPMRAFVRVAGGATNESAYFAELTGGDTFRIRQYAGGTLTTASHSVAGDATMNFSWSATEWYWIRIVAAGPLVAAKAWADESPEPTDFMLIADASEYPGLIGVGGVGNTTGPYFDVVKLSGTACE